MSLVKALDVVGERWTLVIVQELLERPRRYGALLARLPGISTSVLADGLRTLERAGVVSRRPGAVGAGVVYALTDRGQAIEGAPCTRRVPDLRPGRSSAATGTARPARW